MTISALRTIADPTEEDNREDQVMALRVLSAGNVIIIGCLTLILALQVCRYQGTVEFFFQPRKLYRVAKNGLVAKKRRLVLKLRLKKSKMFLRRRKSNDTTPIDQRNTNMID